MEPRNSSWRLALIILTLAVLPVAVYAGGYYALGKPSVRLIGCCCIVKVRVFPSRWFAEVYRPAASVEGMFSSHAVATASLPGPVLARQW